MTASPAPAVIWHDLECGGYRADLPLWRELAAAAAGRNGHASVLDIGAGGGRVALDLAALGHHVTAIDSDAVLLAALAERAAGMPIETIHADARDFTLERTDFDLCLVPMQTLQLLRGGADRSALFGRVRPHLRTNALLACAIVDEVDCFDSRDGVLGPAPERIEIGSTLYMSRPVRVQRHDGIIRIERERLVLPSGGVEPPPAEQDLVELEIVDERTLHEELRAAGYAPEPTRVIDETDDYASSTVVIARA